MKKKLQPIYEFLRSNMKYNKNLQENEYKKIIYQHSNTEHKVIALLYNIVNTQSQPKIDPLAEFFTDIVHNNFDSLKSFESFVAMLGEKEDATYLSLYKNLKNRKGWGDKTSSLFTKVVFNIHCGNYGSELAFWHDAPTTLENDKIYLPVDAVIIDIFKKLDLPKLSFSSINNELEKHYTSSEMVIWDDLWFWGFINQKGSGKTRTAEWNPNKYWALENSDKNPVVLSEVKAKSAEFRKLILIKSI